MAFVRLWESCVPLDTPFAKRPTSASPDAKKRRRFSHLVALTQLIHLTVSGDQISIRFPSKSAAQKLQRTEILLYAKGFPVRPGKMQPDNAVLPGEVPPTPRLPAGQQSLLSTDEVS